MAYSNEEIPNNLLEILENAETFEVYFHDAKHREEKFDFSKYIEFEANLVNKNLNDESRKNLISSFIKDVEKGGEPSRCWIPHHGIRAIYNNQLIEIAICFMCGWFRGETFGERFDGTFPSEEESQSKILFDKIIAEIDYES